MNKYDKVRPNIPAETARAVKVQAGHKCSIAKCSNDGMELHHIDENRNNNSHDNLIYLCANCHTKVHDGKIDRKSLRLYKKKLLSQATSLKFELISTRATNGVWTITNIQPNDCIKIIAEQKEPPPQRITIYERSNEEKITHTFSTSIDIIISSTAISFYIPHISEGIKLKAYRPTVSG